MTVPIGGVSIRSMVNRAPYLPLLSWAAIQLFSMHRFCTKGGGQREGRLSPQAEGVGFQDQDKMTYFLQGRKT